MEAAFGSFILGPWSSSREPNSPVGFETDLLSGRRTPRSAAASAADRIVSRRDVHGVFLRPDEDIAGDRPRDARRFPQVDLGEEHDLIRVAGRLAWDVDRG
jgi:hypothetical protein